VRFTLDSNILVYGVDSGTPEKHAIASDLILRAALSDAVLTAQALAEFLAVIRRKLPAQLPSAAEYADRWAAAFPIVPTTWEHVSAAASFAARHKLQLWDSIIWQGARMAGASLFLSEDLQDGLSLEGMTVLDPFKSDNRERLGTLLEG
jgi:predicted nucleic acid-binding protein